MSIPPLVCSTPPPPEQCEDDKDNEDFDIQYSLSQEDDDNIDYDYGNFNSYSNFHSVVENDKENLFPKTFPDEEEISDDPPKLDVTTDHVTNSTVKVEENTVEDLDLKLDQVSINSDKISQTDYDDDQEDNPERSPQDDSDKVTVPDTNLIIDSKEVEETFLEPLPRNNSHNDFVFENNDIVQNSDISEIDIIVHDDVSVVETAPLKGEDDIPYNLKNVDKIGNLSNQILEKQSEIDDFGDFDDFKLANSEIRQTASVVSYCDNPWGSDEGNSNFEASFDDFEIKNKEVKPSIVEKQCHNTPDPDDDFGDFDDFKSSTQVAQKESEEPSSDNNIFNVQSTEDYNQMVEKALSAIFEFSIPETEPHCENKLESSLCEVWGHLTELESRQPYMINWNNSLGQKSLLRALCIDSRNILFGPKWTHSMPKYAANLGGTPLQPQKPSITQNAFQNESTNAEKSGIKSTDGWVDPFTSEGKEFTYAEALLLDLEHLMATLDQMAHNHSSLKISDLLSQASKKESSKEVATARPTNLNVFGAESSLKPENIYSSTMNVQPLRQINLPDTHIFTPTDSEIPRSKTIHYDTMPQPINSTTESAVNTSTSNPEDEYSDFQDFKSSVSDIVNNSTIEGLSAPAQDTEKVTSVNYDSMILQPIKIEPTIPTLDWPDPGEIKTEFEDFSKFMSDTPWQSVKVDTPSMENVASENKHLHWTNEIQKYVLTAESSETNITPKENTTFLNDIPATSYKEDDDEFETFQSAIPESLKSNQKLDRIPYQSDVNCNNLKPQSATVKRSDLEIVFPEFNTRNSLNIVAPTLPIPNNQLNTLSSLHSNIEKAPCTLTSLQSQLPTPSETFQVLQPITISTASTAQKSATAQILQPLSLEGYSQINWPNPGSIDLQDLSRFNPVETLTSLKGELNGGNSKTASPVHSQKFKVLDDDWGDFVSSKPKQPAIIPKTQSQFAADEEWTDFVSSPVVQPQNGLNTISLNVHTNLNVQKSVSSNKYKIGKNTVPLDVSINYVTPKTNQHHTEYSDRHFQNL